MSKRADDLAKELDLVRARFSQTVKDINSFLSPMAILARNMEKITKIFSKNDESNKTTSVESTVTQIVTAVTSTLKKSKTSEPKSDDLLGEP